MTLVIMSTARVYKDAMKGWWNGTAPLVGANKFNVISFNLKNHELMNKCKILIIFILTLPIRIWHYPSAYNVTSVNSDISKPVNTHCLETKLTLTSFTNYMQICIHFGLRVQILRKFGSFVSKGTLNPCKELINNLMWNIASWLQGMPMLINN